MCGSVRGRPDINKVYQVGYKNKVAQGASRRITMVQRRDNLQQGQGVQKQHPVRGVARPAELHTHEADQVEQKEPSDVEDGEVDNDLDFQGEPEDHSVAAQLSATNREPLRSPMPGFSQEGLRRDGAADPRLAPEAVREAQDRALRESQTIGGRPGPAATTRGTSRKLVATKLPEMDVESMSREEMIEAIKRLSTQRQGAVVIPLMKAMRWNNGAEPNYADNGEMISARDSGSISVYGFMRRPITLYPSQWVQLAHYIPDVLHFIESNLDAMNDYVNERLGNESKALAPEEVEAALKLFVIEQEHDHGRKQSEEQGKAQQAGQSQ
jgi:hypothetical protein